MKSKGKHGGSRMNEKDKFIEIEEKVKEISKLDYVNDAYLDEDCLSEGYLAIQIELKGEDEE